MAASDGRYIVVEFSEALSGTLDASKWHVFAQKATPGGWFLTELTKQAVEWYGGRDKLRITLPDGNQNSLQGCGGTVTVRYTGGSLRGQAGPLLGFSQSFAVSGVDYRGNQFLPEHVFLSSVGHGSTLTQIWYTNAREQEHLVSPFSVDQTLVLTKIEDI